MNHLIGFILSTLLLVPALGNAAELNQHYIATGSPQHFFGPPACNGGAYNLVEKTINAYVTKTYIFVSSAAPAIDLWLRTDADKIIGEVHHIKGKHPGSGLNYWEAERDFSPDAMWVGKVWVFALCYGVTGLETIEPYAVVYTRAAP